MDKFFDTSSIGSAYDVVIIGGGAAGCTAAMYTSRDELSTLLLEKTMPGGQMGITAHIDNHPGIPETMVGADMAEKYQQQAARFGAILRNGTCTDMNILEDGTKEIYIEGRAEPIVTKTLIIATGVTPKKLGVPGENRFWGRGVSACATCDGGFYKDKTVVAVGGGNTALNESIYLTRFASKIYLVHRRNEFRGTKICQRAALEHPKIELVLDSAVREIKGENTVSSVIVENLKTGEQREIATDGVFTFIGHEPAAAPFDKYVNVDHDGFIITNENMETNIPGVFAAGDIRVKEFRQIATATGDAATAAHKAAMYIQHHFPLCEAAECKIPKEGE